MTLSSAMHSGVNPTWNTNRGNINQFRSRSLNDLPGSLRVPILKKHDRLKPKIEASLAGLKELQNLRDQQQKKFEEAISNFGFKDGRRKSAELSDVRTGKRRHSADFVDNSSSLADYRRNSIDSVDSTDFENLLQKNIGENLLRSNRQSYSSLTKIAEEENDGESLKTIAIKENHVTSSNQSEPVRLLNVPSRSRRPLSLVDCREFERELQKDALEKNRSTHSLNEALLTCSTQDSRFMPMAKSGLRNTGRTQSLCVHPNSTQLNNLLSTCEKDSKQCIQPQMRRGSLQCEKILTNRETDAQNVSLFAGIDSTDVVSSSGPLHAILMQHKQQSARKDANVQIPVKDDKIAKTQLRIDQDHSMQKHLSGSDSQSCVTVKGNNDKTVMLKYSSTQSKFQMNDIVRKKSQEEFSKASFTEDVACEGKDGHSYSTPVRQYSMPSDIISQRDGDTKEGFRFCSTPMRDNNIQSSYKYSSSRPQFIQNDSGVFSDEGYCASLPGTPKIRHKLSLKSESSWISTDLDESRSTEMLNCYSLSEDSYEKDLSHMSKDANRPIPDSVRKQSTSNSAKMSADNSASIASGFSGTIV